MWKVLLSNYEVIQTKSNLMRNYSTDQLHNWYFICHISIEEFRYYLWNKLNCDKIHCKEWQPAKALNKHLGYQEAWMPWALDVWWMVVMLHWRIISAWIALLVSCWWSYTKSGFLLTSIVSCDFTYLRRNVDFTLEQPQTHRTHVTMTSMPTGKGVWPPYVLRSNLQLKRQ